MTNYYFDTCIWRDYYENRTDRFRPLGEWALELIKVIEVSNGTILYSELIIDELKNEYSDEKIKEIMNTDTKTRKVSASKNQIREAEILGRVRGVGFGDAMHVVFARDSNAILITRDKHFIDFTDIATIRKPEELI